MDAPPKRSKALLNAVQEDSHRQAVDSAKKRAVAQAVDYDAFKNMVAAAHLKPLQAKNTSNKAPTAPAWMLHGQAPSTFTDQVPPLPAAAAAAAAAAPGTCTTSLAQQQVAPHTSLQFARDWRRLKCAADKFHYLQRCGAACLRQVFRADISSELLQDILRTLWQQHRDGTHAALAAAGSHLLATPSAAAVAGPAVGTVAGLAEGAQAAGGPAAGSSSKHGGVCAAEEVQKGSTAAAVLPAAHSSCGADGDAAVDAGHQAQERFIWQVLQQLPGAGRFQLTVQLLDRATQATTRDLINQLAKCQGGAAGEDLQAAAELCGQYCL